MKSRLYTAFVALAAVMAAPSPAAMVTLSETLDLRTAGFAGNGFTGTSTMSRFAARPSITLAEGDTLDYTIRFARGETLTLDNLSFIWALSYSDFANSMVDGSGTFAFLGSNGRAILTSAMTSDREGHAHFGQQFYASDFGGALPGAITFSGIHYQGMLTDYENPAIVSRTYSTPAFFFQADRIITAVPEPTTWAMLLCGFAMTGAALRRRTRQVARA